MRICCTLLKSAVTDGSSQTLKAQRALMKILETGCTSMKISKSMICLNELPESREPSQLYKVNTVPMAERILKDTSLVAYESNVNKHFLGLFVETISGPFPDS